MDNETILKRLQSLEKKVEKYYKLLLVENELDFILNGTYCFESEIDDIMSGNYKLEVK